MKVTQVSIRPTQSSEAADRPALTPELLAATGARYSRNNEGLESILKRIDPNDLDKSVDSIFRFIDYGHQSIADMVPVCMFIDEVSILLAYLVWSWCPTASGQESSTRYIKLGRGSLIDPEQFGLSSQERSEWLAFMDSCFDAYEEALSFWTKIGVERPELTRIPRSLLEDSSERAQRQVSRMKRNFAFDRARYFLPVAARTNMMLIMSARGWVQLCQRLLAHWLPEANNLGIAVQAELEFSAPRMIKYVQRNHSFRSGFQSELQELNSARHGTRNSGGTAPCNASITIFKPEDASQSDLVSAMQWHENRYAFVGTSARRTSVRFSWSAVAMAEIRDLNRHRTGEKYCPLVPLGFYHAQDQIPDGSFLPESFYRLGDHSTTKARDRLDDARVDFCSWLMLGSQFFFEHTTTLDKFIYEAELRTGAGAHYRYAKHLTDSVLALESKYPDLAKAINLGSAEPE